MEATALGHAVTLFEMAPLPGGRARRLPPDVEGLALDNGQHILIGAYSECLRLLRVVGLEEHAVLQRTPLALLDAQGRGLRLPAGPALPAFVRGALAARGWSLRERLALLGGAGGWLLRGFRCEPRLSVAGLTARWPAALRRQLIEPLCVAALNTPAEEASAQVFLRVLRDALFAGRGASDLLLPRVDLSALWPDAAARWLQRRGARLHTGRRVEALRRDGGAWQLLVGGEELRFERVLLACSAVEAARLVRDLAPRWAALAQALRYEPIVTVLLRAPEARLPAPMLALQPQAGAPAQYVFDLGQLRDPAAEPGAAGVLACVVSGAASCIALGLDRTAQQVLAQAATQLADWLPEPPQLLRVLSEKRATFACTPGLARPPAEVADGLLAAGDYIAGPYPATLEGAVRSGVAAARATAAAVRPRR